jgi:hypothetical protein
VAEEVTLPEVGGSTLTLFPGQPDETQLDFSELFPGADGGDLADYTDVFGSDLGGAVNALRAAPKQPAHQGLGDGRGLPGPARECRSLAAGHDQ